MASRGRAFLLFFFPSFLFFFSGTGLRQEVSEEAGVGELSNFKLDELFK